MHESHGGLPIIIASSVGFAGVFSADEIQTFFSTITIIASCVYAVARATMLVKKVFDNSKDNNKKK